MFEQIHLFHRKMIFQIVARQPLTKKYECFGNGRDNEELILEIIL